LKKQLEILHNLKPSKCISGYQEMSTYNITCERGYPKYNFHALVDILEVNNHMQTTLANVDPVIYTTVARYEFQCGIEQFEKSQITFCIPMALL
jgi:hypothetical protein